jgi:hypothetical protein
VLMPCLSQYASMVVNDPLNPSELRWSESPARLEADGVEPVLRNIVVSFDVNAYRFTTITRIEEEAVRTFSQYCRHRILRVNA